MIRVLEEEGIYPDHVMGSSVGSILGGLYSLGYSAAEVESLMVSLEFSDIINERQARPDLYPGEERWPSYGNLRLPLSPQGIPQLPAGVITGAKIDLGLARILMSASPYRDFSLLPVNFAGLTIDMRTGELIIHHGGSLMQSIRGAATVPSVIGPYSFNGRSHIDGGLLQNLPVPQVVELGADKILALKINTSLRGADPKDIYGILNHTINIAMHQSIDANLELCDLILEPDLTGINNLAYARAHEISMIGENYARANIGRIRAFRDSLLAEGYTFTKPQRIPDLASVHVGELVCRGNDRVPAADVIAWSGLASGREYLPDEILDACSRVWDSAEFHSVYPVLEPLDEGYRLALYVREREPRYLHLNTAYTLEDKLSVGATAELNDVLLPNSRLLAGITLGGRNELNLDLVKDFGAFRTPYARLYPYLKHNRAYRYDALDRRIASLDSLEFGLVPALGFFADRIVCAEAFAFFSRAKTYSLIPNDVPDGPWQNDAGIGLKLLHESLDADVFPRSGARAFLKTELAPWAAFSGQNYARLTGDLDLYASLASFMSLRLGFAYGSHYGNFANNATDLLRHGGSAGFTGHRADQAFSPDYKYGTLAAVFEPLPKLFLETGAQALNTAGNSDWSLDGSLFFSYYAGLGYRSPIGPLGVKLALREDGKTNFYFNIGYTTDLFWFSRK